MCLYDLQKAFNSVEYPLLLTRVFGAGVNGKTWRLLWSWYDGVSCCVRSGGHLSESFVVERGIKQSVMDCIRYLLSYVLVLLSLVCCILSKLSSFCQWCIHPCLSSLVSSCNCMSCLSIECWCVYTWLYDVCRCDGKLYAVDPTPALCGCRSSSSIILCCNEAVLEALHSHLFWIVVIKRAISIYKDSISILLPYPWSTCNSAAMALSHFALPTALSHLVGFVCCKRYSE